MSTIKEAIILEMVRSVSKTISGVRWSLIISIVASVVTFMSAFNTSKYGWYTERMKQYAFANKMCTKHGQNAPTLDFCRFISQQKQGASKDEKPLYDWITGEIDGTQVCKSICDKANTYDELMTKRRVDAIYSVKVPWFGVHFDINDLGLFSGFSLLIIMLVLTYNLALKYSNLDKLFRIFVSKTSKDDREMLYDLTTFSQIIRLPKYNSTEIVSPIILDFVPYVLFGLPFIVHSYVLINDLSTFEVVYNLKPSIIITLILTSMFWFSILSLTIKAIKIDRKTDELWDNFETSINRQSPSKND